VKLDAGQIIQCPRVRSQYLTPGQPVELALRPESLRLERALEADVEFEGEVIEVVYLGHQAIYGLRLGDGERLKVSVSNPVFPLRPKGERIRVWADPADLTVLTG